MGPLLSLAIQTNSLTIKFMKNSKIIGAFIVGVAIGIVIAGWLGIGISTGGNLTEEKLESYFRNHTVEGNHAVAIKRRFTVPKIGTAYLGTIHGYPDNLSVCKELVAPYNEDPSFSVIPGGSYFCEVLR
jgi:hypothetical protein